MIIMNNKNIKQRICRVCGDELRVEDNWYETYSKTYNYICKNCVKEYYINRRKESIDRIFSAYIAYIRSEI